ncbi:hypothetical protein F4779DRAFT_201410 [Xylariaceae sp. FL0662B]|nr:hypothetical protein F4779DRAFT_201410 [Xylariaceae sp. FL0662B]
MAATSTSTSTSTPSPTPTPRRRYWEPMFYNCVVAVAGDLGDDGWRPEDVSRWVTHRGGNFLWQVKEKVTHVLATDEQFRSRKNAVIKKIQGYRKGVHVVTRDWLEDSINARRRLREDNYSLARREEEDKAEERRREATKKAAKKAAEQEVNFVNPNLNHIYRDSTYFPYQIKLTRNDEESGNVGEKYMLYLFESNSKPHLYIAAAKFWRKPHDRPSTWRSGETGKTFDATLALFKDFFYRKTGLRWDERVAKRGTTTKDKFQYEPPVSCSLTARPLIRVLYGNADTLYRLAENPWVSSRRHHRPSSTERAALLLPHHHLPRRRRRGRETVEKLPRTPKRAVK